MAIDMGSEIERFVLPPLSQEPLILPPYSSEHNDSNFCPPLNLHSTQWNNRSSLIDSDKLFCVVFCQCSQNKALDRTDDDMDELVSRVKGANQRTRRLLGK